MNELLSEERKHTESPHVPSEIHYSLQRFIHLERRPSLTLPQEHSNTTDHYSE